MLYDLWQDDVGMTLIPTGDIKNQRHLFVGTPRLIRTIEGATWEEAMKKLHELHGWEPYKPIKEE